MNRQVSFARRRSFERQPLKTIILSTKEKMFSRAMTKCRCLSVLTLFALATCAARAQHVRGELRLEVRDPQGAALSPAAELISDANQLRRSFQVNPDGHYVAQDLPFGVYRLTLNSKGFAQWTDLVEIRSEVPVRLSVTLGVATVTTRVEVSDSATLV